MKFNFLTSLTLIVSSILLLIGCVAEDPCPGEPLVINYNEPVNIRLHASDSGGILFDSVRPIKEFIITEHGDTISYTHKSFRGDSLITFVLHRFSAAYIWKSFGTIMTSKVILKYDTLRADTLHFSVLPRFYENQCNKTEYEKAEILLNGELIKSTAESACFMCGDTLIINLDE